MARTGRRELAELLSAKEMMFDSSGVGDLAEAVVEIGRASCRERV